MKDYEGIERFFAGQKRRADCIPNNAREWTRFFDVFDKHEGKSVSDMDRSFRGITKDDVARIHPMRDSDYKKTPWECAADLTAASTMAAFAGYGFDLVWYRRVHLLYQNMITCYYPISENGAFAEILPRHVVGSFVYKCQTISPTAADPDVKHTVPAPLTSLRGMPETVGGNVNLQGNLLENLVGSPREIGGDFICRENPLKSLDGGPELVKGKYDATKCSIESLRGGPRYVGKSFIVSYNGAMRDLNGGPLSVGGDYRLTGCKVHSLEGVAPFIGGSLILTEPVERPGHMPEMVGGWVSMPNPPEVSGRTCQIKKQAK